MSMYADFAQVYDRLMRGDVDYGRYADYIENLFALHDKSPELVCDLACGTGNMTIPLARRGYSMTGVDISPDMLSEARRKSGGLDILYLCQPLTSLDLYGTMDAFVCVIDGFNYVLVPKLLENALKRIRTCFLNPGGIIIFDISTRHKLKNVLGSNTFIYSEKDIFYAWRNRYIEKHNISDMLLDFFVREGDAYRRFEERHLQRAWSSDEIKYILKRAGFESVFEYGFMTFDAPAPDCERTVFAAPV